MVENAVVAERLTITKNTKCQRTLGRHRANETAVGGFGRKEQEETEDGGAVWTTTTPPPGLILLFDGRS